MAGTVLADTNVFARKFDQEQWQHAFGLQLIPARVPKTQQDAYTVHQWWFGTPPPTDNNYAHRQGRRRAADRRLQLAGAEPHARRRSATVCGTAPPADVGTERRCGRSSTYGDHGFWPATPTTAASTTPGILYWDPKARRPRRDRHRRQRHVPARRRRQALPARASGRPTPVKLFDPADTVTIYRPTHPARAAHRSTYPVPAGRPGRDAEPAERTTVRHALAGDGYPALPLDVPAHDPRRDARDHGVVGHLEARRRPRPPRSRRGGRCASRAARSRRGRASCRSPIDTGSFFHICVPIGRSTSS